MMRCRDDTGLEGLVQVDDSTFDYRQVNISTTPWNAQLMWGLPEEHSQPITVYRHFINGEQQEGLFLGAHNVTRWGVQRQPGTAGSGHQPWWMIRLLGPNSEDQETGQPLMDGEYRTYLRVAGT